MAYKQLGYSRWDEATLGTSLPSAESLYSTAQKAGFLGQVVARFSHNLLKGKRPAG